MAEQIKYYKAKQIVVWDKGEHRILENGYLGVKGTQIEGFHRSIPEGAPCEDLGNAAITPGFINLHSHPSEVYTIKSYLEDTGNVCFYESGLYDTLGAVGLGENAPYLQTKINLAEMLKSGCTTITIFGGPYSRLEAQTAGDMGIRAYVGAGIRAGDAMEEKNIWYSPDGHSLVYDLDEKEGMERIREAEDFVRDFEGSYEGRIRTLLGPTQSMTCTPAMLTRTRETADRLGVGVSIHIAEAAMEFESCMRMYGKTPVQMVADTGLLGEDVIIAHCVYVTGHSKINMHGDGDLKILGGKKVTVAHSPTPFIRKGEVFESFEKYGNYGVNVGIGTDAFPSDIIQEMRLAAIVGKTAEQTTFTATAKDMFNAVTVNGAKAFGRTDIGRLAPGAKADFVVFDLENIEMTPIRDLIKNIVYSSTRHSVDRVYVDGRCLVKGGQVEGFDEKALCRELQESAERAWAEASEFGDVEANFPRSFSLLEE
ncbi:amidohydrolase family protein [Bacilliculturomica massiliensis]|uniref:amidohydrolase family protein n=1 Tax=Bacilliculturomica massiliensis TaxID=1917867 RepID=UPI0010325119|nr:amidohydrolase family protein [Bacilliculturomica massiliensis]